MVTEGKSRSALLYRIENLLPTLSKSEQKVARYILDHSREIIYLSVAALADCCHVSDPTVVRACQKLGYSGYQDIKISIAQTTENTMEIIHEDILASDTISVVADKVFQSAFNTLRFTHDNLGRHLLETSAAAIQNARKIMVVGMGGSGGVAFDFTHKLLRLGLDAVHFSDPHLMAVAVTSFDERDLLVNICHSGSSRIVVENARLAQKKGTKILSITSSGKSPLSRISDIVLNTVSNETQYRIVSISSRIAAVTILDTLYTYLALKSDTDAIRNMAIEENQEYLKY